MNTRVEILWAVKEDGQWIEKWLPGVLLKRWPNDRCHVRTDCGRECGDAAPECVREPATVK